ncbi:MAG: PIG-L deacetylase family protein [bacterium]
MINGRMNVVAYLAHADDEVLGCGGLLAKLAAQGHHVSVVLATDGIVKRGIEIDNTSSARAAAKILGARELFFLGFPDQQFDRYPLIEFNRAFDKLGLQPDLLITHAAHDANHDHTIIHRSAIVVIRPLKNKTKVLACETLSATEWGSQPFTASLYADITDYLPKKIEAMKPYANELREFPHPRSLTGIEIKARQRGLEVGCRAAEAYQVLRWFEV